MKEICTSRLASWSKGNTPAHLISLQAIKGIPKGSTENAESLVILFISKELLWQWCVWWNLTFFIFTRLYFPRKVYEIIYSNSKEKQAGQCFVCDQLAKASTQLFPQTLYPFSLIMRLGSLEDTRCTLFALCSKNRTVPRTEEIEVKVLYQFIFLVLV